MDDRIEARVVRVELFEDRASVTRELTLPAGEGARILRIGPLSPLLRPEALSITAEDGDVVVEEIDLRRELVSRAAADDPTAAAVRAELEAVAARVDVLSAELEDRELRARRAEIRREAAAAWGPRALVESGDPAAWAAAARELAEQWAAAALEAERARSELATVGEELLHLEERLAAAREGSRTLSACACLRVVGPPGAVLRLRYTLPCAVWRPVHRARLAEGAIEWEVAATAWNATGEDWRGVQLVCSTARPGERAAPPRLQDDRITGTRRAREVVVEAREEEVQVAREGSARPVDELPGVDDGGEVRTFTAPAPVDLPSDGRPVLVPLDRWRADATVAWVATPEEGAAPIRTTRQVNAGPRPLLAGPVHLFTETGAVGRTRVGLIPPGEPFRLGWGSHDDLRVARKATHERSTARLTGRQSLSFRVELRLAHLGGEPVELEVRERIPVSELAQVTVSAPQATPPLASGPDADGLCAWRVRVAGGETRELTLTWTVEAAAGVSLPW